MRLKTEGQNDCRSHIYIYILSRPLQCTFYSYLAFRGITSVLVQYLLSSASALKLMLWCLDTLLKESVIGKINTLVWFHCMKKSLMEDKRNNKAQRPHTHQNSKRLVSLVSLLLWLKIAAVQCFIWRLGLWMLSGSEAVWQNLEFLWFLKIQYPVIWKCFLVLNAPFDVRWTSTVL